VGADTGRDGIHGASGLASRTDPEARFEEMRPAVQVGNPFMEKLLMEACFELASEHRDWIVGLQDLGAAGLTSSVAECCAKGNSGAVLELANVPRRESGMTPYEVMLSESQERMLVVARREHADDVANLFRRWELHCEEIGQVTEGHDLVIHDNGVEVARIAVEIAADPPQYRRQGTRPQELAELNAFDPATLPDIEPGHATATLLRLLARPNIASKRGVYRQYDQQVLGNTVVQPGGDAAVLRVAGTNRGIALKADCNGRVCYLDPFAGGAAAVAEAARNVVCTGATPVAITDCLNFGNPEKLEVYYTLEQSIRGIAAACTTFNTPVVSGNVSLYNESGGRAVYPTPVVGMLGILDDVSKHLRAAFDRPGAEVWLLGAGVAQPASTLAGSEYLEAMHGRIAGLPAIALEAELRLHRLVLRGNDEGLLLSAHDCSDGGLAVAIAESCMFGDHGFDGTPNIEGRLDAALFGEAQGRIVVSLRPEAAARLGALASEIGVAVMPLGSTLAGHNVRFGPIDTTLDELVSAYEALL